jgi:hypothetical protein
VRTFLRVREREREREKDCLKGGGVGGYLDPLHIPFTPCFYLLLDTWEELFIKE